MNSKASQSQAKASKGHRRVAWAQREGAVGVGYPEGREPVPSGAGVSPTSAGGQGQGYRRGLFQGRQKSRFSREVS